MQKVVEKVVVIEVDVLFESRLNAALYTNFSLKIHDPTLITKLSGAAAKRRHHYVIDIDFIDVLMTSVLWVLISTQTNVYLLI